MAMRTSSRKKESKKKKGKGVVASPLRRKTLATLAVVGLGAGLSSFGLFGKNLLQPFKNIVALPLFLNGERMKSKGELLFLVKGWVLSEQDLHSHKKK